MSEAVSPPNRPAPAPQWRLCVLVTEAVCPGGDWLGVAAAAVEAGADAVQLREKGLEDRELLARARRLVQTVQDRGAHAIVNDRPDVALIAGADAVHLGQQDLPVEAVRRLAGAALWIGASTADLAQAGAALAAGADFCGVGPMFPTATKHKETIAGPPYARAFRDAHPEAPHVAIGGIRPENAGEVFAAGAAGIAVSAAVCAADDPRDAVRALLAARGAAGPRDRGAEPL